MQYVNGKRPVDPLLGKGEIREARQGRVKVMGAIREAIDKALAEAALPSTGGHRHMRLPLTPREQEHHEKVDRYLRRIK